jgi:hypothetical protein
MPRLVVLLLAFPFFLPWFGGRPTPVGPTIFPGPVRTGEVLRFVVAGPLREDPASDAPRLAERQMGDTLVVRGTCRVGESLWIAGDGWVEASRVDRIPEPLEKDPRPGREGLATGRVLPWDWRPADLVQLPDSVKAPGFEGKSMRMRRDAAESFVAMVVAARADGVDFAAFSAFRDGDYQHRLYSRAVAKNARQRTTAAPGRCEHQLGTTVDVATPTARPADPALERTKAGRWIERRAGEFGFVVSFSRDRHEARGVAFEPWHLRWVDDRTDDDSDW